MDLEVQRIQRRGVLASRAVTTRIRSAVIGAMTRRHYVPGVKKLVRDGLLENLQGSMLTAHLTALQRGRSLSLSIYDDTLDVLARRLDLDVAALQVKYKTKALKVLDDVSDDMERRLASTLNELMAGGAHVDEAISVLNDEFDALGLSPQADYRLESIFRTQSQLAYGAGRWEADQDPDIQAELWGYTYSAVGDTRTRETHMAMDGVTLPKDDQFWQLWWPPNGWNCRCQVIPLFSPETVVEPDRSLRPDPGFEFNPGKVFAVGL